MQSNRRRFIRQSLSAAAAMTVGTTFSTHACPVEDKVRPPKKTSTAPPIRFSVIGLNHGHIYGQTRAMLRAGAKLVSFYAREPDLIKEYQKNFPDAKLARSEQEILEDTSIQLVVSASIPH